MMRIFLIYLASVSIIFVSGCAASEAAREDQINTPLKATEKPVAPPVNNGSAVAAKMISPVTGY
jgi:hypothetical protein